MATEDLAGQYIGAVNEVARHQQYGREDRAKQAREHARDLRVQVEQLLKDADKAASVLEEGNYSTAAEARAAANRLQEVLDRGDAAMETKEDKTPRETAAPRKAAKRS